MKRIALSLATLAFVGCQPAPPATEEAGPLEGAWQHVELSTTTPDTSATITSPQPSLYLFLKQHYSIMFVPGSEPRALFAGDRPVVGAVEPTEAEKLAAYDSFIANAGTYELTDSTLTTRPVVAKNPNVMAGESLTFRYQVAADTLRLTFRPPWAPDTEIRYTLVRLE